MTRILAAIVAVGCGCGGGGHATVDGGGGSGGSGGDDGPPVGSDGPPGATKVRVRFWNQGQPVFGATVLFQASGGALLGTQTTDDQGSAALDVPGIATVSALIDDTDGAHDVFTWLGVHGGDELAIGSVPIEDASIAFVSLRTPATSSSPVTVVSRCGSTQATATLGNYHPCGTPTSWLLEDGNTAWYSGTQYLAQGQDVNLTAAVFHAPTTVMVGAKHLPADPGAAVQRVDCTAGIADRAFVLSDQQFAEIDEAGAAGSMALAVKDLQTQAPISATCAKYVQGAGLRTMVNRHVPQSGGVTFDFANPQVPTSLTGIGYSGGTIAWTEGGGGGGDFAYAAVSLRGPTNTVPKPRVRIYVTGPKVGAALTMPVFPAPYDADNPAANDTATVDRLLVGAADGGYDGARPHVHRAELFGVNDWLVGSMSTIETP